MGYEDLRLQASGTWLGTWLQALPSDLRIEIEERLKASLKLFLDLVLAALEQVHGYTGFVAVFQFEGSVTHFCDFLGGKHPKSIYKCQVRHLSIVVCT